MEAVQLARAGRRRAPPRARGRGGTGSCPARWSATQQAVVDAGPQGPVEVAGSTAPGRAGRAPAAAPPRRPAGRARPRAPRPRRPAARRPRRRGMRSTRLITASRRCGRHGRAGVVGQRRRQLLDEQRVAVGPLDDAGGHLGGAVRPSSAPSSSATSPGPRRSQLEVAWRPGGSARRRAGAAGGGAGRPRCGRCRSCSTGSDAGAAGEQRRPGRASSGRPSAGPRSHGTQIFFLHDLCKRPYLFYKEICLLKNEHHG